jgi:hypothetical protein
MPFEDRINDLSGVALRDIQEISIGNYYPLPNCQGKPTQVHVMIWMKNDEIPLTLRLKSARAVDELIAGLARHRSEVFGPPDEG